MPVRAFLRKMRGNVAPRLALTQPLIRRIPDRAGRFGFGFVPGQANIAQCGVIQRGKALALLPSGIDLNKARQGRTPGPVGRLNKAGSVRNLRHHITCGFVMDRPDPIWMLDICRRVGHNENECLTDQVSRIVICAEIWT